MGRIHDVSLPLGPDLLVWPKDPPIEVIPRLRMTAGDPANVSELRIGTHSGTHVDPPLHFVEGGSAIDDVSLDALLGEAVVADLGRADGPIGARDLESLDLPQGIERLLLRTASSALWQSLPAEFPERYACLSVDGARWVVERGIRLIGVDFLSVEQRGAPGHPVHVMLLENGVVIVEGLNLYHVAPGAYTLVCLPLRIVDGDGGPARAVLIEP